MNFEILIPITLFICVVYAIKVVVDARTRAKLIASNGSEDLIRSLVQAEALQRRHASLRWGILLLAVGLGFALIEAFGWTEITPGVVAVLLGVTGLGNLAAYAASRKLGGGRALASHWLACGRTPGHGWPGRAIRSPSHNARDG